MKRTRKGTTCTGAIPACMAEVSPARARSLRMQRWIDASAHAYDRAMFGYHEVMHGPYAGYGHDFGNALDGVTLFASSHPARE